MAGSAPTVAHMDAAKRTRCERIADQISELCSYIYAAEHLQDAESVTAAHDDRQLSYRYDHDGCLVIKGRFPAEQGALIVKALEMAVEAGRCELPPISTRRADALAEIAETYMNSEPVPNSTADRYQVVVHVGAAESPHIENGAHVSAETSRRVSCDSSVVRVDEDKNGEPMSVGRKTRSIPPAIRRALRLRDDGCRLPGCTNDRFVDGHHIEHWADGGETSRSRAIV